MSGWDDEGLHITLTVISDDAEVLSELLVLPGKNKDMYTLQTITVQNVIISYIRLVAPKLHMDKTYITFRFFITLKGSGDHA